MQPDQIRELLEHVKSGTTGIDEAFVRLAELPFSDLGDAKLDNHRALRCGFAEVVLCRGKEPRDVARIIEEGMRLLPMMLATRAEKRHVDAIKERFPGALVNLRGGTVRVGNAVSLKARGSVMVVTAGTGDIPVAEEALETLRAFGCDGYHCYDVGVAGLHRVLAALPEMRKAAVIICVAGMEGALPSVLSGLVACPVIAVPTSVGYGASFGGVAALLGMLNSCAGGVSVVNIDNGYGAAMIALRMIADRDYPIVEVPAKPVEMASAEDLAAAKSAERDEHTVRLEKIVAQLAAMAQKPVVVESPRIEINHPNQDAQVSRLEKAIVELAAIASKQKEFDEKKLMAKSAAQDEFVLRLEKTAHSLATMSNKAVVVESPKIEINHPNQDAQVSRLEKAIVELASIASKQKEFDEKKLATKSAVQDEFVSRLEKTAHSLATMSNKAVVVESPKIEINHPNQDAQVSRLEKAIVELAAIASKIKDLSDHHGDTANAELAARLDRTVESLAVAVSRPVVVEFAGAPPATISANPPAAIEIITPKPAPSAHAKTHAPHSAEHATHAAKDKSAVVKDGARSKKTDSSAKKSKGKS